MSFKEQENALFDLLFDKSLRKNFCKNSISALERYDLDDHELDDFKVIRTDAIELDASMRTYLILTHICRQFPVTFSLVSSLHKGINLLEDLINLKTMRSHPAEHSTAYGSQLLEQLPSCKFDSEKEQSIITAIMEAELGMTWTSATLKHQVLAGETPPECVSQTCNDWLDRPIKLAAYVSAAIIPQSYMKLKETLCPCEDTALWAHLCKKPLSESLRKKTLVDEDPKLFITRAHIRTLSRCESTVDHATAELTEGFAPLFQHINGSMSIAQILGHLRQAGATEEILQSVQTGFQQLLNYAMLEFV